MMELLRLIIYQGFTRIGSSLMYIGAKLNLFAMLKCIPKECKDEDYDELLEAYNTLLDMFKQK